MSRFANNALLGGGGWVIGFGLEDHVKVVGTLTLGNDVTVVCTA